MKKIFSVFLIFFAVLPLYSDFKILAGFNFSEYKVRPLEGANWDHRLGFNGGIGFEKKVMDGFILEFDLTVVQKGSRVVSPEVKAKYLINAASVPFLLKIKPFLDSSPYLVAGAELSYMLSHKTRKEGEESEDIKDSSNRLGYGFVLGGGLEVRLKEFFYVYLEVRYYSGLSRILQDSPDLPSMKARSFVLFLGVKS